MARHEAADAGAVRARRRARVMLRLERSISLPVLRPAREIARSSRAMTCSAPSDRALPLDIPAHLFILEEPARLVDLVEGLVEAEAQVWGELEPRLAADDATQFGLVAREILDRRALRLAAQRHDEGGGDLEIGRAAYLAHRDRQAVQFGVVDVAAHQHLRQRAANEFADPQLSLRGAGAVMCAVLCHCADVILRSGRAKRQRLSRRDRRTGSRSRRNLSAPWPRCRR